MIPDSKIPSISIRFDGSLAATPGQSYRTLLIGPSAKPVGDVDTLAINQKIEELSKERDSLPKDIEAKEKELKETEKKAKEAEELVSRRKKELETARGENNPQAISSAEKALSDAEKEHKKLVGDLKTLRDERSQLENRLQDLSQQITALETKQKAPITPIQITTLDEATERFGKASVLTEMVRSFREVYRTGEIYALPTISKGNKAKAEIRFSGEPTETKEVAFFIAGREYLIPVEKNAPPASVATALFEAIEADDSAIVRVTTTEEVKEALNLEFQHAGSVGNGQPVIVDYYNQGLPAGLQVTITPFTGGMGEPDEMAFESLNEGKQYHVVATAHSTLRPLKTLDGKIAKRWESSGLLHGVAVTAKAGSKFPELDQIASKYLCPILTDGSPSPSYVWSAALAGLTSLHGPQDPGLPFQTLPLPGVLPDRQDVPEAEREARLAKGISTTIRNDNGGVEIERLVTAAPNDPAFADLNDVLISMRLAYDFYHLFSRKYARYKLASDDVGKLLNREVKVITPAMAKAEVVSLAMGWQRAGLLEDLDTFTKALHVWRPDGNKKRLNFSLHPNYVDQLRQVAAVFYPV